jgi:hypothetical protein
MAEDINHIAEIEYEIQLGGVAVTVGLIAFSVNDSINKIPRARLEFNYNDIRSKRKKANHTITPAANFEKDPSKETGEFLPGKTISIKIGEKNKKKEIFTGYITKQNITASSNGKLTLCIDCKHAANKTTLVTRTRFLHHDANNGGSAQEKIDKIDDDTYLEHIVNKGGYGLELKIDDQASHSFDHENMLQYNCSDWDFLITRIEATGRVCRVDQKEIHVISPKLKNTSTMDLILGENLIEYEAEHDETLVAKKISVASWETEDDEVQAIDDSIQNEDAEIENVQSELSLDHGGNLSVNEVKTWIENKKIRQQQGKILGLAKIQGTSQISVADTVSISGFDSVWDRDAFVSGIGHVFKNGGWYTYVQCGLSSKSHAEKYQISGSDKTSDFIPSTNGLLYGKVVKYKEGESGEELLEVEIPSGQGEKESRSIYARLATFSAGEKGGAVFRPYPKDEVVIGFINNDPRFPVVLGALYNGKNKAQFELSDDKQVEVGFVLNDWKMSFHEEDDTFSITAKSGQQIMLDEKNKTMTLAFDKDNTIEMEASGITIKGAKIELDGGKGGVTIKGATVETSADATVDIKGKKLSLSADALIELKAQMTQIN